MHLDASIDELVNLFGSEKRSNQKRSTAISEARQIAFKTRIDRVKEVLIANKVPPGLWLIYFAYVEEVRSCKQDQDCIEKLMNKYRALGADQTILSKLILLAKY
jgi:hypothetical protein